MDCRASTNNIITKSEGRETRKEQVLPLAFYLNRMMKQRYYILVVFLVLVSISSCSGQEQEAKVANGRTSTRESVAAVKITNEDVDFLQTLEGKIVFQSDRDGDWEIYAMNADGSNLVQLTHNTFADEYPVWSPDGEKIAFKSHRDGNYEIYVMNADGTEQTRLTNHPANDEDPDWSPDGKKIAFHSDRDGKLEIYVMNADGSNVQRITNTIGKNALPAWSPDGKSLAYTGNRYLGWGVYVVNLDGSGDQRLEGGGACRPDWSPDGKKLAYVSERGEKKTDIWIMNADGGEKRRLTNDEKNYDYYPSWSPDGKYLVYAKSPDKNTGNWELYIISSDGSKQARLTNHPARDKFPDWQSGRIPHELVVQQKFIYEVESLPRTIGTQRKDPEASEGQAVYAGTTGEAGFLAYGPYISYEPGEYTAIFRLKTDNVEIQEPVAQIDVVTDVGKTILARKMLNGNDFLKSNLYQEFQIPYSLKEPKKLEFRVYSFALTDIWADKVTVQVGN